MTIGCAPLGKRRHNSKSELKLLETQDGLWTQRRLVVRRKGEEAMDRKLRCTSISTLLGTLLATCGLSLPANCQSAQVQAQPPSSKVTQIRPVSLEHLYWHFLTLQNFLDTKAVQRESQGKDGSGLHNNLQKMLGWSDTEYAPIHTSAARLTAEVNSLNAQAATIWKANPTSSSRDQLHAVTVQREADINAEIAYLKQHLPPGKIKTFEVFLIQFFSPAHALPRGTVAAGQKAPVGVQ